MTTKFDPKIHHRRSIRMQGYNYTQRGAYFITIATWQRENLFGEIIDGQMRLNKFGLVARQQWEKLPRRFPHIELDEFVVMPNHFHGIVFMTNDRRGTAEGCQNGIPGSTRRAPTRESFGKPVAIVITDDRRGTAEGCQNGIPGSTRRAPTRESFGKPVAGSIPTIIRSYKAAVTLRINWIRGLKDIPVWQSNYYEHVIRDEQDCQTKRVYILNNPMNWEKDDEYLK